MKRQLLTAATCVIGVVCAVATAEADELDAVRAGQVVLRRGARGATVVALQRRLTAVGHPLVADGVFGPKTEAAVRAFQRSRRLVVDGIVGRQTATALGAGTPPPTAPPTAPTTPPPTRVASIPARPGGAVSGSAFLSWTGTLSRSRREAEILGALETGNIPSFLRRFVPVTLRGADARGVQRTVVVQVMPDVLAIGSDADFVRIPTNPRTAQRVADRFGCVLPTRKLSDAIWRAATVKLAPVPLTPGPNMMSNGYFRTHQARVEAQWRASGATRGTLVAGHKKDVVLSRRLETRPTKVAIYGWHRTNGRAIQPLSTVHGWDYADYSHGIRLIHAQATLDGQAVRLADLLTDPVLWPLVSDEGGAFRSARIP